MKLTHIRLLVNDTETSRVFYRDTMGLKETLAVPGGIYYEFEAGDCILGLYKRELMETVAGVSMSLDQSVDKVALTFNVANVDATYKELTAKGVAFATEPHNLEAWYLRVAHLRDPEGNLIEINAPHKT